MIAVPYLWLLLFFLVPFAFVLKISFSEALIARPPYSPLFEWSEEAYLTVRINFENFLFLLEDDLYWKAYLNSSKIALISTIACLLLGYPMAYGMARANPSVRNVLLMMVIPVPAILLVAIFAGIDILGLFCVHIMGENIGHGAHLGGFCLFRFQYRTNIATAAEIAIISKMVKRSMSNSSFGLEGFNSLMVLFFPGNAKS